MGFIFSFCIPAFNEEENIELVLQDCIFFSECYRVSCEIVVVNDCSTDGTSLILNKYRNLYSNVKIVENVLNLGCHLSVKRAFDCAEGEWLVFLPADRQIKAEIVHLARPLLDQFDLIATKRVIRKDVFFRRLVSAFYNNILRFITGIKIHDFDSSIIIRKSFYNEIRPFLREKTASLSVEIAVRVSTHLGRVCEIPIPHYPRVAGVARGLNIRDIWAVPSSLFRLYRLVLQSRDV